MNRNCVVFFLFVSVLSVASGQTWVKVNGVGGEVRALAAFNNLIYAGGVFTESNGEPLLHVGVYGGRTWGSVGAGFDGNVNALHALGGELLFAAGSFTHSGTTLTGPTAQWNGSAWTSMGLGISGEVYCLGEFNGTLYAGGNFYVQDTVYGLAKWDGERWVSTGVSLDNAVYAITNYGTGLVIGGDFTYVGGQFFNHIARFDGSFWTSIGTGDNAGVSGAVRCMGAFNGKLIVGGGISDAGTVPVNNIAAWNDTVWSALGSGLNGLVTAVAVNQDTLFAAGTFSRAGDKGAQNVALWANSEWNPLSVGVNGPISAAVGTPNGLYVGGLFTSAGGLVQSNFARWSSNANVATIIGMAFRDRDGKYQTLDDRIVWPWGLSCYRDSISPGTLLTSGMGSSLTTYTNHGGRYILVQADSGSEWSRLGPRRYLADTLTVVLNSTVVDSFVNFHVSSLIPMVLQEGWNLVSSPVDLVDNLVTDVFPNATSSLFSYSTAAGYRSTPTIEGGPGYWLKFGAAVTDTVSGGEITHVTVSIKPGWNIIGSITSAVPVVSLLVDPPGILRSPYYEYGVGYHPAVEITPGKGYWIKSSANGTITLTKQAMSVARATRATLPGDGDELTITDAAGNAQTLSLAGFLIEGNGEQGVAVAELPPPPPAGGFDVRFQESGGTGAYVADGAIITMQGVRSPVTISWKTGSGRRYRCSEMQTGSTPFVMTGEGSVRLGSGAGNLHVVAEAVIPVPVSAGVPKEYALSGNYPNPFNPSTSFVLDLPADGSVTVVVYDQLGREAFRIADQLAQHAGRSIFQWHADGMASGVYHYRVSVVDLATGALRYSATRSMVLVK